MNVLFTLVITCIVNACSGMCPSGCLCTSSPTTGDIVSMVCSNIEEFPDSLPHTLTSFTLKNSRFAALPSGAFDGDILRNLTTIHFDDCVIDVIEPCAFQSMMFDDQSSSFEISDVRIKVIKPGAFVDFYGLGKFMFKGRSIETIAYDAFRNWTNINSFHITESHIDFIDSGAFKEFQVSELYIYNNQIQHISNSALQNTHGQKVLVFKNTIKTLESYSFHFNSTPSIKIYSNTIVNVKPLALGAVADADELRFSENTIHSLGSYTFEGITQVENVNVYSMKVNGSLPEGFFPRAKHFNFFGNTMDSLECGTDDNYKYETASIYNNYVDCDCRLIWAVHSQDKLVVHEQSGFKCYGPSTLTGRSLAEFLHLNETVFPCYEGMDAVEQCPPNRAKPDIEMAPSKPRQTCEEYQTYTTTSTAPPDTTTMTTTTTTVTTSTKTTTSTTTSAPMMSTIYSFFSTLGPQRTRNPNRNNIDVTSPKQEAVVTKDNWNKVAIVFGVIVSIVIIVGVLVVALICFNARKPTKRLKPSNGGVAFENPAYLETGSRTSILPPEGAEGGVPRENTYGNISEKNPRMLNFGTEANGTINKKNSNYWDPMTNPQTMRRDSTNPNEQAHLKQKLEGVVGGAPTENVYETIPERKDKNSEFIDGADGAIDNMNAYYQNSDIDIQVNPKGTPTENTYDNMPEKSFESMGSNEKSSNFEDSFINNQNKTKNSTDSNDSNTHKKSAKLLSNGNVIHTQSNPDHTTSESDDDATSKHMSRVATGDTGTTYANMSAPLVENEIPPNEESQNYRNIQTELGGSKQEK